MFHLAGGKAPARVGTSTKNAPVAVAARWRRQLQPVPQWSMREIVRDEVRWQVYEMDAVDGASVVRRAWTFPVTWAQLEDEVLWSVLEAAILPDAHPVPHAAMPAGDDAGQTGAEPAAILAAQEVVERTGSLVAELRLTRERSRELMREYRGLTEQRRALCAEMRVTVEQYALVLRAQGVRPERALLLLKSAMRDGLASAARAGGEDRCDETGDGNDAVAEELLREGIAWGIAAYYAA
jgi:hypothetical protein